MKRIFSWMIGAAALTMMLVSLPQAKVQAQPGVSVSFQMFYDELAPYGQWIDDPEYGYVWAPQADDDFRPYFSNGRWAMTEYGNTWVSDYDWGWAPFHYGRWTYDNYYGWVWIPGDEWGPAWVNWRSGGGYYGWAPLGPGMSFNVSVGSYYNDWWVFIPNQYIYSPNYYSYWRGPRYNSSIFGHTTIINNYYNNRYVYGPRRNDIERYTGHRVNIYNIRNERGPRRTSIRNNQLAIYRPQITRSSHLREAPRATVRPERSMGSHNNGGRSIDRNNRSNRETIERTRPTEQRNRVIQRNDPGQVEPQRMQRENMQRQQVERQNSQRINEQRQQQVEQQRMQRENTQRQQVERQNSQRINEQRQQQVEQQRMQRENVQRQQAERQNSQRINEQRQQMERERPQQQMQRQPMQQQRREAPQREWRRPEPQQIQRQESRIERPQRESRPAQVERSNSQSERSSGHGFGRGR